uniref:PRO1412 n=1 Tax=Homo sapiens TaxID=9606 RepID=Q9P1H5_HUMAN|nr:PRO1412 [Homo sapiens]
MGFRHVGQAGLELLTSGEPLCPAMMTIFNSYFNPHLQSG